MLSLASRAPRPFARAAGGSLGGQVSDGDAAAIRELIDGIVSANLGRGPRVSTYVEPNVITLVLEDPLTAGERRLVREGLRESVLSGRRALQRTMREELKVGVERVTGRKVLVTEDRMTPAVAVEVLVLGDGPSAGPAEVSAVR